MRYLLLISLLFAFSLAKAQNLIQEFDASPEIFTLEQKTLSEKYENLHEVDQAIIIQIGKLSEFQFGGNVGLKLPLGIGDYKFRASRVEYQDEKNYTWYAERIEQDTLITPDYVLLTNTDGFIGGEVSIGKEFLRILPISDSYQIALKISSDFSAGGGCKTKSKEEFEKLPCVITNDNQCSFNVLIAYPPNVEATYPTMLPIGRMLIEQLNTALSKSKIKHRAKLVGMTKIIDTWVDDNIDNELTNLQELLLTPTSSFLSIEREKTNADIVLFLSNGASFDAGDFGLAAIIAANSSLEGCAIAKMEGALGKRLTFTHEIGHLLGGGHDDFVEPARAHAFSSPITGYNYLTVLHLLDDDQRLLRFSNPEVKYYLGNTGTETRNNACVMQNAGCDVSTIMTGNTACSFSASGFFDDKCYSKHLTVTLSQIENVPNGCSSNFYYDYYYSIDGINFTSACGLTLDEYCEIFLPSPIFYYQTVFVKIEIRDFTLGVIETLFEWYSPKCDWRFYDIPQPAPKLSNPLSNTLRPLAISLQPNPSSNSVVIFTSSNVEDLDLLEVLDVNGKIIYQTKCAEIIIGEKDLSLNIDKFINGFYYVKIFKSNGESATLKMIKV